MAVCFRTWAVESSVTLSDLYYSYLQDEEFWQVQCTTASIQSESKVWSTKANVRPAVWQSATHPSCSAHESVGATIRGSRGNRLKWSMWCKRRFLDIISTRWRSCFSFSQSWICFSVHFIDKPTLKVTDVASCLLSRWSRGTICILSTWTSVGDHERPVRSLWSIRNSLWKDFIMCEVGNCAFSTKQTSGNAGEHLSRQGLSSFRLTTLTPA